jgi:hypothetical protein
MLKEKLMNTFKGMFGGNYSKENGKVFWSKDGVKKLVTTSFLKHFIGNKKDPSSNDASIVVSKVVSKAVGAEASTTKPPSKKAKKNAKDTSNNKVSEGS